MFDVMDSIEKIENAYELDEISLTEWEINFLDSLKKFKHAFTEKQVDALQKILNTVEVKND